jgi:hypothetical protein
VSAFKLGTCSNIVPIRRRRNPDDRSGLDDDEARILRCVATAAIMQASAVSTELREELTAEANLSTNRLNGV